MNLNEFVQQMKKRLKWQAVHFLLHRPPVTGADDAELPSAGEREINGELWRNWASHEFILEKWRREKPW